MKDVKVSLNIDGKEVSKIIMEDKLYEHIPQLEPILKSRFALEFPKEMGIEWYDVTSVSPIRMYIDKFEDVSPVTITLLDTVESSLAKKIMDWMKLQTDSNEVKLSKKNLILNSIDSRGFVIRRFNLHGCRIINVTFPGLDYSNDKLGKIIIEIQPEYVDLHFEEGQYYKI